MSKKDKNIKVVVFEPNKNPEVREIPNELEAMQQIVGGYIEIAFGYGKYLIVCNEEGKLLSLPFNKSMGQDYLVGTVFAAKEGNDGEFADINESDIQAILELWDRL